jgi:hypothetical protein
MKAWNINKTQYKVSDFISWQRSKSLVLSPSFQRRPVWKKSAKSYLMDTIVRGLPIPIIFLRERQTSLEQLEPRREVVDGQQRMRYALQRARLLNADAGIHLSHYSPLDTRPASHYPLSRWFWISPR